MTTQPPLYAPFATFAKLEGLESAITRFQGVPGLDEIVTLWEAARKKIEFGGPIIARAGGNDWYSGPTEASRHWKGLLSLYEKEEWPQARINSVDDSSSLVVAHTPNPKLATATGRGLVVGFVQSGKTTNFIAVAAKMADENYNFVIILSGIHNGLRRQTQERVVEQLEQLNPTHWHKLTDEDRDFRAPTGTPSSILASAADRVVLAVVKKNAAVLRKLVAWLSTDDGRRALSNSRVLVIDDEADQASVATGSINPLILEMLELMPYHTYIGYTATPFANVFINPADKDLYPKDFILSLPKTDDYFGPEKIFGRYSVAEEDSEAAPDGYDMIRHIPDSDVGSLRPMTRRDAETFEPDLTDDVVNAIRWFWLATAARRARGDNGHSTMLVHTSVKTDAHEKLEPLFQAFSAKSKRLIKDRAPAVIAEMRRLWEDESSQVPATDWGRRQNTFEEVLEHLDEVLEANTVVLENSRSSTRLDYSAGSVVAIAIGGNTLSRGLTLEGLVVSVFVRGATAYDTLLQMGRWFGYRKGYEDLPRIWMTQELELAFRHLAQVEHEMRADIRRYQTQNRRPDELAVRIRTHPALQITAKMGAAVPAEVSYAGSRLQTRYFHRTDHEWLAGNLDAAARLLRMADQHVDRDESSGHIVFRGVPVSDIRSFLSSYSVHEDSPDMNPATLLRYIDGQVTADGRLSEWNVVVANGSKEEIALGPIMVRTAVRSRLDDGNAERADIKTLMSRPDIGLDFDDRAANMSEDDLKKRRDTDPALKDRGLLVLYVIDPVSEPQFARRSPDAHTRSHRVALDAVDRVVGIGLYFPGDASSDRKVRATHVAVQMPEGAPETEKPDRDEWEMDDEDAPA